MKFKIKNTTVALLFLIAAPLSTFFIVPHSAEAAITVSQNMGEQLCEGSYTCSASFGSLPAAGSTIVVTISYLDYTGGGNAQITPTDVTDNQGHTLYNLATAAQEGDADSYAYVYYISNISAPSGTYTITIDNSASGGDGYFVWTASEVGGLAASPLDRKLAAKGTGTSLTSGSVGPTGSTAQASEISFAVMSMQNTEPNNAISTPGSGYNELYVENNTNSDQGGEAAYKILSSTGTQTASWTWADGADFSGMVATFKGATGFSKAQTGVVGTASSGNTVSCVFGTNPAPGDLVAVGVEWYDGIPGDSTTMTVADGAVSPNSYTVEPHTSGTTNSDSAGQVLQAYLLNAPSNANKTMTATFSKAFNVAAIWWDDFTVTGGSAAYDNGAYASGTDTVNTPTIPVSGSNELLYAVGSDENDLNGATGPWTFNDAGEQFGNGSEWILSASANTAVGYNGSGGWVYNAIGMSFSFTPSGGGGGGATGRIIRILGGVRLLNGVRLG